MCLAIPMKIIKIEGNVGTAELEGLHYKANLQLLDSVKAGDYVLIHAGFAIEKIDQEHAITTLNLLRGIMNEENS